MPFFPPESGSKLKAIVMSYICMAESLKEISPQYSSEGLMLKLKLQYVYHLMRRTDSLEKTLMLGKTEGGRIRGRQRMGWWTASPTRWTWVWISSWSWWWAGKPGVLQSMGSQIVRHNWATELNWRDRFEKFLSRKINPAKARRIMVLMVNVLDIYCYKTNHQKLSF